MWKIRWCKWSVQRCKERIIMKEKDKTYCGWKTVRARKLINPALISKGRRSATFSWSAHSSIAPYCAALIVGGWGIMIGGLCHMWMEPNKMKCRWLVGRILKIKKIARRKKIFFLHMFGHLNIQKLKRRSCLGGGFSWMSALREGRVCVRVVFFSLACAPHLEVFIRSSCHTGKSICESPWKLKFEI